ncbi:lysophospholipid acyltransferase family protein [Sulfidibacter corallicola]|uniref:Lysophospholipid acyltransferase family protein n=1 Tax=Sulfidibacter corallicola TaxID=2818388 RepID=A0A8A4TS71_SULCO|nr:lysophospholipid acyltransferase family protein [Sulfidibacter corallicola]QTD49395.1 lysophospholipid acyltransferase family protein [Sulfidibacter corallicola]
MAVRRLIGKTYMKLLGFKAVGEIPTEAKVITLAVPHTTNWDLPNMLFYCFSTDQRISFMMKASVFRWPFGGFFRAMGGIPIDRSKKNDTVAQMVKAFEESDYLNVVIPPEGTRGRRDYWKTGFYYIALEANIPIVLGFLDYARKEVGYGPVLHPTGDIEKDFEKIAAYYKERGVQGKYPKNQSEIRPRPRD